MIKTPDAATILTRGTGLIFFFFPSY